MPFGKTPVLDNPILGNPITDNPTLENPTQLNKDILSKELLNTDVLITHSFPILSLNPFPSDWGRGGRAGTERKRKPIDQ